MADTQKASVAAGRGDGRTVESHRDVRALTSSRKRGRPRPIESVDKRFESSPCR
jgi:hypothetical protein